MGLADRHYTKRDSDGGHYRNSRVIYNPNYRPPRKMKPKRSIWERIKYAKNKGIILGIVWFLILLFIMPVLEGTYTKRITDIGAIFILISFVLGIYNAYPLTMWIDRRIPNTDFGIWLRRIVAGIMVVGGFGFAILIFISSMVSTAQLHLQGVKFIPAISFLSVSVLFASFFIGIAIFAGYVEFTHERRAGTIVFFGKTKY